MSKKLLFCIAILMSYNTKIHSIDYLRYAFHYSCKPTALLASIASLAIFAREQDKDLIYPLVGITALSTAASGISCLFSMSGSKYIALRNCNNKCQTNNLRCTQHSSDDHTISQFLLESTYRHSHRLGCLVGLLTAGSLGYLYQNYSA